MTSSTTGEQTDQQAHPHVEKGTHHVALLDQGEGLDQKGGEKVVKAPRNPTQDESPHLQSAL
jgi:hypothetical protein